MDKLKLIVSSGCVLLILCFFCTTTVSPTSQLPRPTINSVELTVSKQFKEAIHISWSIPPGNNSSIMSFTILRMTDSDSFYNVYSENIPADTFNFYDPVEPSLFPTSSAEVKSVYYRIFAIDDLDLSGDTSEACTLSIVQQPSLSNIDLSTQCLTWSSNIHFGGLFSYCKIWMDSLQNGYTGPEQIAYPPTDNLAVFTNCFSEKTLSSGRWQYAIFIKSIDASSVRIGYFDVP